MIHLKIYGGLGNQIFQFGAALFLAKQWGKTTIKIDDTFLAKFKIIRENQLIHCFNFDKLKQDGIKVKWEVSNFFHSIPYKIYLRLLTKIVKIKKKWFRENMLDNLFFNLLPKRFINDVSFYNVIRENPIKKVFMDDYFQTMWNQKDINECFDLLRRIYIFSPLNNSTNIDIDTCIIHVRGTDFISLGWHNVAGKHYYEQAANLMVKRYGIKQFKVVTDDISFAKKLLKELPYPYTFCSTNLKNDFDLLIQAPKKIIANSTFSITAAMLGIDSQQIVIAPQETAPGDKRNFSLPGEVVLPKNLI